jgi:hypothetical protein
MSAYETAEFWAKAPVYLYNTKTTNPLRTCSN